jgi:hypothetical protein
MHNLKKDSWVIKTMANEGDTFNIKSMEVL